MHNILNFKDSRKKLVFWYLIVEKLLKHDFTIVLLVSQDIMSTTIVIFKKTLCTMTWCEQIRNSYEKWYVMNFETFVWTILD